MAAKNPPEGYHTVTPSLIADGAGELLQFITDAFGGGERMRMPMPDGKIAHSEIEIGDAVIMVGDPTLVYPAAQGFMHLYVDDADTTFKRATEAGATVIEPLVNQFYGDRSGTLSDRWGNRWTVSTHVEDVDEAEMMKRMEAMTPGPQ